MITILKPCNIFLEIKIQYSFRDICFFSARTSCHLRRDSQARQIMASVIEYVYMTQLIGFSNIYS